MAANFCSDHDAQVGRGYDALMRLIADHFGTEIGYNLDITLYRDFARAHQKKLLDVPEQGKCNRKAAALRQEGNRLYVAKKYDEALVKYNESICFAETGSDQLGLGFGNRSAVYFEEGEYEFALANIALAKKHNYPEKLKAKLLAREKNCWDKLDNGQSKGTVPSPRMVINVNVNPKVPFIADGISMKLYNNEMGRGLVAKKDFNAGTVILDEKAPLSTTQLSTEYSHCGHCIRAINHNLIPCPGCVSILYCREECLQEDKRFTHRFDCAIADKLRNVMDYSCNIGPKQFFYGLTLFGDDLQAMMDFCNGESGKGVGNPFTLDFRRKDLLEQFKVLQKAGVHHLTEVDYTYRMSAAAFYVVYRKNPLVQQLVKSDAQRNFMLRTFLKYIRNCYALMLQIREGGLEGPTISMLPFVGSLVNTSCDPNTVFAILGGQFKIITIRPIKSGEQITMPYGPTWWQPRPGYKCTYKCICPVCADPKWTLKKVEFPQAAKKHFMLIQSGVDSDAKTADLLNMLQQFVNRYVQYHPSLIYGVALSLYRQFINVGFSSAERALERARALGALE